MIQELQLGDPKISFHGAPHLHHPSPSLTSSTATNNTNATNSPSSTSENQNNSNNNKNKNNSLSNLRCPRCDSANTKFCYYNNYNLTQPRHFCKTCRRYWTKGGALRNVPIGGGCRKNKNTSKNNILSSSKSISSGNNKFLKAISPEIIGRSPPAGLDYELPPNPNPILWGSSSSSSSTSHHLLTLLRSATAQNPNPSHAKKEAALMSPTEPLVSTDHLAHHHHQLPSLGLCTNSIWRSSNQPQQQNGAVFNIGHDLGMQELYQRLIRSSSATTNYNLSDHSHSHSHSHSPPVMMSNAGSYNPSSSILDQSAPVVGGELGYGWNTAFSWPDLSTTNGAYP